MLNKLVVAPEIGLELENKKSFFAKSLSKELVKMSLLTQSLRRTTLGWPTNTMGMLFIESF